MSSTRMKSKERLNIDPMSRVLASGPRLPVSVTVALAVFLHVGVAAAAASAALYDDFVTWHRGVRDMVNYRLSQYEMDIVKEPPPPPPPEPEPEPEPEKPAEKAPPPPEAAPQPAQAGKILAAEGPAEPGVADFVTGQGDTYVGGNTSAEGKSTKPIYNPFAANTGTPNGTGTAAVAAPVRKEDKSKVPGLLGSVDWNDCPFPGEADAEQIDRQVVMIQVKVKPDGSPDSVVVTQDPGHGFGREARKCAMRKKFTPGADVDGNPVGGMTKPFRVRFER